jgi:hypothetical protein
MSRTCFVAVLCCSLIAGCLSLRLDENSPCRLREYIDQIESHVPSACVLRNKDVRREVLSGVYVQDGPERQKRGSAALATGRIYLFPEGEYFFTFESDISREQVLDKGKWKYDKGFVSLLTEGTLSKRLPLDKEYLVILASYCGRPSLLLVGTNNDREMLLAFAEDEKQEEDNGFDSALLICSYERDPLRDVCERKDLKDWLGSKCASKEEIDSYDAYDANNSAVK